MSEGRAEPTVPDARRGLDRGRLAWLALARVLGRRRERPARHSSLRLHVLRVVLSSSAPLLLFAAGTTVFLALEQRRTFERGALERTRALLTALETELERSIAVLEALSTSDGLQVDDLLAFREDARRVLASRPEWLTVDLAPRSGRLVMSLLGPHEARLDAVGEQNSLDQVFWSGQPVVGPLFREPVTGQHVFAVRVPVRRDGSVVYALTALVKPEAISALLHSQALPSDWVGVVLDRNQTVVARTVEPESTVGRPASQSLRDALVREPAGFFHGSTIEGWDVYTPYDTSAASGWTVAIGIPARAVESPFLRSLVLLSTFGLVSLSVGLVLALFLSQRSARAIQALVGVARDVGQARAPSSAAAPPSPSGIQELEGLRAALSNAARLIQARSEERDRVEVSLRSAEAALRQADQRKDRFLAMLGHELRNPLGIISTAVQLLKTRPAAEDPELTELRQMIERQVKDMTRLLDDLLDVSRIAQGRVQAQKKLCDLVAIVRDVLADRREAFERSRLSLEVALPDQPLWIMGDPTRLSQAVSNVLNNAEKYTSPGGRVSVRLGESPGGEEGVLTVADTGVGMEPEILAHAFEPFSQADRTIDRSRGGLGLGLALVKGLVELHGGEVIAHSEGSGRGTEITLRLPLEPGALPARKAVAPRRDRGRPHRVLVVEDNRMAARSLEMFLVEHGHTVEVAHSGQAGIDVARRFRPEVVLCDIGLPESDGYHVARVLRGDSSLDGVHLIAVTGYGQRADQRNAQLAGFDRHLTKPVDLDELHEILTGMEGADPARTE